MKNLQRQALLAACAALTLCAGTASAQTEAPRRSIEVEDARGGSAVLSVTGEVTAVDVANRIVSIKGPRGNINDLRVDPAVRNLEQVKVGDRVRLSYRIGVAVALVKGGDGIRERVETDAAAVAQKGARPGGIAVNRTTIVANVFSLDRKKNIVTLRGTSGQLVDVHVRDPKALQDVKVGDQVVANITESVALRVTPAPAK
ncbi:hypothetical protein [Variovorax ginsengisoli]|uniref:Uncharacterized protein n=1 Tax=Variovorax ginsengisoli TaxID=363844 RepID=A0ABT8RZY9_9BURK|nr:hypothetical protein [Variovorax ginsengisoli]MDN8613046.1 hypothetical protein [Variovorax ginsengisoli]MDO1532216.1 hypothetical protein [Variovorax ginsengisoli]